MMDDDMMTRWVEALEDIANAVEVHCETVSCGKFIASGKDWDDALEKAIYEENADYHEEASVVTCEACYDAYMQEGMREAGRYAKELADRQLKQDHENYIDSILSAADLSRDIARGK